MFLKRIFLCIFLLSLVGCAENPGIRVPRDGRILPEIHLNQVAYKTKQQWDLEDLGVVALAKSILPIMSRSEYILGFGIDHEEYIVELNVQEVNQAEMWEFDDFHIFMAVDRESSDERMIVNMVVIDDRSAELEEIAAPPDRQMIFRTVGDGVLLGLMGDSLDSSEFWSVDEYGVDEVRERDLEWSQLQYFQAQAFEIRQDQGAFKGQEDASRARVKKVKNILPKIEEKEFHEDNTEKVEIDLSE